MDWTNRRLVQQSFILPGAGVMEAIPAREVPEMPAPINMQARVFCLFVIREIVRYWDSIAETIRQWFHDWL